MILLRKLTTENISELVTWCKGDSADDLYQWAGGGYKYPLTQEQVESRLISSQAMDFSTDLILYGVYAEAQNAYIGTLELTYNKDASKTGSLGRLYVNKAWRGKGYCLPIAHAICKEFFDVRGFRQLFLKVFHFNEQAIRCYEHVGFQKIRYEEEVYQSGKGPWHRFYMQLKKEEWIEREGEYYGSIKRSHGKTRSGSTR